MREGVLDGSRQDRSDHRRNRGLGRSAALALARRGVRVVVTHRGDADGAEETAQRVRAEGGTAAVLRLDIRDVSSFGTFVAELSQLLERYGDASRLDIMVNNAGVGVFGPLEAVTPDDFDTVFDTNVRGTFFLIQSVLPLLAPGAGIINVSSSLTRHTSPATSVYSASKAAVEIMSRTLAAELGPRGIRVNSLAPGADRHRLQRRSHAGRWRCGGSSRARPRRRTRRDRRRDRRAGLREPALGHRPACRGLRRRAPLTARDASRAPRRRSGPIT